MKMTNGFLPDDYKMPKTDGGYMKFTQGANSFRILGKAILGREYFGVDNKPRRFEMENKPTNPADIKPESKVKHFRAFPVFNYQDNAIQILQLTQSSIMGTMKEYFDNAKWGNPMEYDFIIGKTGEKLETEYTITVNPKEKLPAEIVEAYKSMTINLEALFEGKNPFEILPF